MTTQSRGILAPFGVAVALFVLCDRLVAQCVGDCDNDGRVGVSEVVMVVGVALGSLRLGLCTNADADVDRRVGIDEALVAVSHSLRGCPPTPEPTATPTSTTTDTPRPTESSTATPTSVPSDTPNGGATPTPTATTTDSETASPTPTATPLPPQILHFGVAGADDVPQTTRLFDDEGRSIYVRFFGSGLSLIVEALRGAGGPPVGRVAFDPDGGLPDLQMLFSRPLGDGSAEVCDFDPLDPSMTGGVFAVESLDFSENLAADAANDIGCRVNDGTGIPQGRTEDDEACTRVARGDGVFFAFFDPLSEIQYCLPIASNWAFPPGDTVVAVRVRDERGALSEVQEIVIRVLQGNPGTGPEP